METECYPCIPMHSASNQQNNNHLKGVIKITTNQKSPNAAGNNNANSLLQQRGQQRLHQLDLNGETITIKHEPLSPNGSEVAVRGDQSVNVVDDGEDTVMATVTRSQLPVARHMTAGSSLLLKSQQQSVQFARVRKHQEFSNQNFFT